MVTYDPKPSPAGLAKFSEHLKTQLLLYTNEVLIRITHSNVVDKGRENYTGLWG